MPMSQTVQGRYIIVPTPENMILILLTLNAMPFKPEAIKQSARLWLKTLTSTFAEKIFLANLIFATKTKKPKMTEMIIPNTKILKTILSL